MRMFLEGKRGQTSWRRSFVDVYTTLVAMETVCEEIFDVIVKDDDDVEALQKATISLRECRDEKIQGDEERD